MSIGRRLMAAGRRATGLYVHGASSDTDASSYTFSSASLGTEATDRVVVVFVLGDASGSSPFKINTVTVAGVSLTVLNSKTSGSSNKTENAIAYGVIPSGSSGSVVVGCSRTARCCAIDVYALYGAQSTPYTSASSSLDDAVTLDLSLPSTVGGTITLASFSTTGTDVVVSWAGVTKDSNQNFERTLSSGINLTTSTGQTIVATPDHSTGRNAGNSLSFAPS